MQLQGTTGTYTVADPSNARHGGQATVYRATAPDGVVVAVKSAKDPVSSEAMERELAALRRLHAENPDLAGLVVTPLDSGRHADGRIFIVFPWYELHLGDWCEDKGLPDRLRALRG